MASQKKSFIVPSLFLMSFWPHIIFGSPTDLWSICTGSVQTSHTGVATLGLRRTMCYKQTVCMLLKGSIQPDSCWDVYSHIYNFPLTWTNCSCFNIFSGYCFSPFYLLSLNLWLPAQTLNCFEGEVNQNLFALFLGAVLEHKFRLKLFLKIRLLRSDLKSMGCNDFSV